jgi:hypothetical protein
VQWAWEDYLAAEEVQYPSGAPANTDLVYLNHARALTVDLSERDYPDFQVSQEVAVGEVEAAMNDLLRITVNHDGAEPDPSAAVRRWSSAISAAVAPQAVEGCNRVDPDSLYEPPGTANLP